MVILDSLNIPRERKNIDIGKLDMGIAFRFLAGFFNEKFRLIDWRWSVWLAGRLKGGVHY